MGPNGTGFIPVNPKPVEAVHLETPTPSLSQALSPKPRDVKGLQGTIARASAFHSCTPAAAAVHGRSVQLAVVAQYMPGRLP